jgi:hypothetical protein
MKIFFSVILREPIWGSIDLTTGGSESLGPPCGVSWLAQRTKKPEQKKAATATLDTIFHVFVAFTLIVSYSAVGAT